MSSFELPMMSMGQAFESSALKVTPLYIDPVTGTDWIEFNEAFDKGLVKVTEIGDQGVVEAVMVSNLASVPLVILEGQGIQVAKQNRALQKTVVIAPNSALEVPVNCVEQGRWRYKSSEFSPGKFASTPDMKVAKSRSFASKRSVDQGMVWNKVAELSESMSVSSESMDLGEVLEKARKKHPRPSKKMLNFKESFDANGFLVSIAGITFLELFAEASWAKRALHQCWDSWIALGRGKRSISRTLPTRGNDWLSLDSVGEEAHWVTHSQACGYAAQYKSSLIHGFLSGHHGSTSKNKDSSRDVFTEVNSILPGDVEIDVPTWLRRRGL